MGVVGVNVSTAARDAAGKGHGATSDDVRWGVPGAVLDGRFVIEGLLGRGGMGRVVLARHLELDELCAIKLLRPDRALDDRARRRLVTEARAAARIRSAHVVRVFDVVASEEESGCPYIVMEYLTGETLAARLARGPLAVPAVARIVIEACETLSEAHENGTVHRDLKPSNLFLTSVGSRDDFVKVLDFGIAKTDEAHFDGNGTDSQALLATPAYASPEQLRASRGVDSRSDIWSMGVIIYECLAGRLPFDAGTLAEISTRILRDEPVPLRRYRPDVPVEIERLIARCLEKQREARLPDSRALVESLAAFAPEAAAEFVDHTRRRASPPKLDALARDTATLSIHETEEQNETVRQCPSETGASAGASLSPQASVRPAEEPSFRLGRRRSALLGVAALGACAAALFFGSLRSSHGTPTRALSPTRTAPPAAALAPAALSPTSLSTAAPIAATPPGNDAAPPSRARRRAPSPRARAPVQMAPEAPAGKARTLSILPLEQLPLDELIDERR